MNENAEHATSGGPGELADRSDPVRSARRRLVSWWFASLVSGALYLLLIDTTDVPEVIVAAGAAAIAATGFELSREQRTVGGIRARLRWLGPMYRPLLKAPSDIAIVALLAFRQLLRPRDVNGAFRVVPFRAATDSEALRTGRFALAESLGSFAPNTIIVGVDAERELLLGHQLQRGGGDDAIDLLGLGAR